MAKRQSFYPNFPKNLANLEEILNSHPQPKPQTAAKTTFFCKKILYLRRKEAQFQNQKGPQTENKNQVFALKANSLAEFAKRLK